MVIVWPLWTLMLRCLSQAKYVTSYGRKRLQLKQKADRAADRSARALLMECISESSFQPLLHLYLLLPNICLFIDKMIGRSEMTDHTFELQSFLQLFSVATSFVTLGWSFNKYQASKKHGALSFTSNLPGRLLLLLSNICTISARLLSLVILAYCFGSGEFLPLILLVLLHICLIAFLHYFLQKEYYISKDTFSIAYECLLNGVGNLYMHNLIKFDRGCKVVKTQKRQIIIDTILIIETGIIVIAAYLIIPDIPPEILVFIIGIYPIGIAMKVVYYAKLHIWRHPVFSRVKSVKSTCLRQVSILQEKSQNGDFSPSEKYESLPMIDDVINSKESIEEET